MSNLRCCGCRFGDRCVASVRLAVALAAFAGLASPASAALLVRGLGAATPYAVLGLPGATITIGTSATTITGNAAAAAGVGGVLNKGRVTGTYTRDPMSALMPDPDFVVTGGTLVGALAQANADALGLATYYLGLTPTQTFGTLTNSTTISRTATTNLISLAGIDYNSDVLTISGSVNDFFIFRVTGGMRFDDSSVVLTGGIGVNHVLFYFAGEGPLVDMGKSTSVFRGTILAPQRDVKLDKATQHGAIIAGGDILIHSAAKLNGATFVPTPGAGAALALVGVAALARRRRT